jgi:hypothetical protein
MDSTVLWIRCWAKIVDEKDAADQGQGQQYETDADQLKYQ